MEQPKITTEQLEVLTKETAILLGCKEAKALVAIGTYMQLRELIPVAKDVFVFVTALKARPIESYNNAEAVLLLELGYLARKQVPLATVKLGRNELCSCGSEKKYKFCCLNQTEG